MIVRICDKCGARQDDLKEIVKRGGTMTTIVLGEVCDFCFDRLKEWIKPTPTPGEKV